METRAQIRARKKYYKTHREIIALKAKKYAETHKEEIALRMKEYNKTHKRNRTWEKLYPEKCRESAKRWRLNNPEKYRTAWQGRALKKFGITQSDRDKLIEIQGGLCPVCRKELPPSGSVIDHSHITGKVRGILCQNCNKLLGFSKDNISILESAIGYLKRN